MANGSQVFDTPQSKGYMLLDAEAGATDDGVWVDVADLMEIAVHTDFSSTGTVEIHGSCAAARPADSADGVVMGTVTGDDLALLVPAPRWVKAKVTANAGTINSNVIGRKPNR
jgi:hypothetical protein